MERLPESVSEVVVAALRGMGLEADEAALNRTILLRDGKLIGYKFRFGGGYALWPAEKGLVEVFDDNGKKTASIETDEKRAA